MPVASFAEWFLTALLILSSLGVVTASKPVYSCLSFLLSLLTLAALYLQLSAEFIAVMQILIYAGAILVIFMFVIVLFQDAHNQIKNTAAQSFMPFLYGTMFFFLAAFAFTAYQLIGSVTADNQIEKSFGTVESIGKALYVDFFFPFEVIVLLFLVALIGTVYLAKKEGGQIEKTADEPSQISTKG